MDQEIVSSRSHLLNQLPVLETDASSQKKITFKLKSYKKTSVSNFSFLHLKGHAAISKALEPYGIGVATGEHCQNRVIFKQFFQAKGFQFCQIDSCRMGGLNEVLAVLLMAAKSGGNGSGVGHTTEQPVHRICAFSFL